jgi:ATP-dependent RNA helicase HelY
MAANLVQRYPADVAHHLLNLSFAQFQTDRDVVALERQLERSRELLTRHRETSRRGPGDVEEYRRLSGVLDDERRTRRASARAADALERLRPGDVLVRGGRHGRVAVLGHERSRRGAPRVLGLTEGRDLVRLSADDFDETPRPVGHIELPVPYAPRNSAFRRDVADRLRRVRVGGRRGDGTQPDPGAARISDLEAQLAAHPVGADRERTTRLEAAASADRLERDVARLERRVRGRSESLARQFDRVLRVLEAWGYVEDWALTEQGAVLARLYTETDLAVAESLREGLLDGLDAPALAALVSGFTFERRGPDGGGRLPPERWPARELATRWRGIDRIARDLNHNEDDAGLPETRALDPGFVPYAYEWVAGEDLADLLADDDEMTGGDFVRHVKQCIDLLRQIGDVALVPATAETARAAADACFRGVIAASSAVEP